MRVTPTRRSLARPGPRAVKEGAERTKSFHVSEPAAQQNPSNVLAPATIATIDALIALQEAEDPRRRLQRAISQGRDVLQLLDALKLGFLSGRVPSGILDQLEHKVADYDGAVGAPELNDVLEQIDLRARVELAKLKKQVA